MKNRKPETVIGPWEAVVGPTMEDCYYIRDMGGAIVATVSVCCGLEHQHARLLAVAPDLARALTNLVKSTKRTTANSEALDDALEALDFATGGLTITKGE